MNKIWSSATLAITLAGTSISEWQVPKEWWVIPRTQEKIQSSISTQKSWITQESSDILVILGSLLLGAWLANPASSLYEKRIPAGKRVGARVMRMLGEDKNKS